MFDKVLDSTAMEAVQKNNNTLNISLALLEDLVQEREEQQVLRMNKFFFEPSGYEITPEIAAELDKAVDAIHQFPEIQLRIEAHTDSRGGSSSNLKLSQRRADAIKKYLLDNGVPESNIPFTVGYGEGKITNNCTDGVYCLEILHKQNERQWLVVLNYDILNQ
jgi:outer membrane protein OmpA-like peptidoglycan-associated protein